MSDEPAPPRLTVTWSAEARSELRSIDRGTAITILHCVDRNLATRNGDVKKLKAPEIGLRLRCGDYRIFFEQPNPSALWITGVKHRREAYR